MTDIFILIGLAANIAITLIVLLRLRQDINNLTRFIQGKSARALVEKVEEVKRGNTKDEVERILGSADSANDKEWVYYLDQHSGYVISFDNVARVESLKSRRS